jgi:hypothetical protein
MSARRRIEDGVLPPARPATTATANAASEKHPATALLAAPVINVFSGQ